MKIKLYEARIKVGESERRLTKAVAKQFPVISGRERAHALEVGNEQPQPLCKVYGRTLGVDWTWLYLLPDENGYRWVGVYEVHEDYVDVVERSGGKVDKPAEVPTIIL